MRQYLTLFWLLLMASFISTANADEKLPKVPFDTSDIVSACSSIKVYVTDGVLYKTETLDKFLTSVAKTMCFAPLRFPKALKPDYDRKQYSAYSDYYKSLGTPKLIEYINELKVRGTYVSIIGKRFFSEMKPSGIRGFGPVETGKHLWYTSAGGGYLSVNKPMRFDIGMFTGSAESAVRSAIVKWIKQQKPSF